jgi:hypothetical protein
VSDHFTQGAFAFTSSIGEAALIEEAWQLAVDLTGDFDRLCCVNRPEGSSWPLKSSIT